MEIIKINALDNGYYDYSDLQNPKPSLEYINLIKEENEKNGFKVSLVDFNSPVLKLIKVRYTNLYLKFRLREPAIFSDFLRIAYAIENNKEIIYVDDDIILSNEIIETLLNSNLPFYTTSFCFFHYKPERDKVLFQKILDKMKKNYINDYYCIKSDNEFIKNSLCIEAFPSHFQTYCYVSNMEHDNFSITKKMQTINIALNSISGPEHIIKSYSNHLKDIFALKSH